MTLHGPYNSTPSVLDTLEAQIPYGAEDADCTSISAFIEEMAYFVRHTTPSQLRTKPGWLRLKDE